MIAIFLAIEMKGLLIGEAADPDVQDRIQVAIEADADVQRLIHFRTQHLGPEELLIAGKVEFNPELSGQQLAEAVDRIEASVRVAVPIAELIYLEPDVDRGASRGPEPTIENASAGPRGASRRYT